jgi:hypothetical protein
LRSFEISWTTGLYGLKFARFSAPAGEFSHLISYNWAVPLHAHHVFLGWVFLTCLLA